MDPKFIDATIACLKILGWIFLVIAIIINGRIIWLFKEFNDEFKKKKEEQLKIKKK